MTIPTPFTVDEASADGATLAASVDHYIDALQVDGIFCSGVMGRSALSTAERRRVDEVVARAAAGRVSVMWHVANTRSRNQQTVALTVRCDTRLLDASGLSGSCAWPPGDVSERVPSQSPRGCQAPRRASSSLTTVCSARSPSKRAGYGHARGPSLPCPTAGGYSAGSCVRIAYSRRRSSGLGSSPSSVSSSARAFRNTATASACRPARWSASIC
jgi:hypothetical protein